MNDGILILPTTDPTDAPLVAPAGITNLDEAVALCLKAEVANGDPRDDTIKGYQQNIRIWLTWCGVNGVNPGCPTRQNVEAFRCELVDAGQQAPTIGRKLTVVRRFYQSAKDRGLIALNPAAGVKPPLDRRVKDRKKSLTAGQAERLLEALPPTDTLRRLRDRAIVGLFLLEGRCGDSSGERSVPRGGFARLQDAHSREDPRPIEGGAVRHGGRSRGIYHPQRCRFL